MKKLQLKETYDKLVKLRQYHLSEGKTDYIDDMEALLPRHRARAIQVAAEMLENEKDPVGRRFAVEFFARPKQPVNAVQTNISINAPRGYAYAPPGAAIVEIKSSDGQATDEQSVTVQGKSDDKSSG